MHGSADPDLKRHTLYFLGGFAAVAVGFVVLLAGFFAGSGPVLYTGAGFMWCAAAVQSLLLFSQSRATGDTDPFMSIFSPLGSGTLYADRLVSITGECFSGGSP